MAKYDKGNHNELPDNTPIELPIGYSHPESLEQVIARMIMASDFRRQQESEGNESFDEADDFDMEEDGEFKSEHEMSVMQEEYIERRERKVERRRASDVVEQKREQEVEKNKEEKVADT